MKHILFEESMEGFSISRIVRDFDYTMPDVHIHYDDYEVYYLLEGERYYFIGTKMYHITPGTLLFIKRNVIHKTGLVKEAHHDRILLEISHALLHHIFSSTGEINLSSFFRKDCIILPLHAEEQNFIKNLLLCLSREIQKKEDGWHLLIQSKIAELFIFALRHADISSASALPAAKNPRHRQTEAIAAYIAEQYNEPLTLSSVAAHFYMNKCYLSRIFKECTGFTVLEYLHTQRIQKARSLLVQNDRNISAVSEAVGYDNLTYFERIFKKYTGMTPLQYRKQYIC